MDHHFSTPENMAICRPHLSCTFYAQIVGKSFINVPSKMLSQGTEEIHRTTLKTPHLELLQAIAASKDELLMTLKYFEKKKGGRRK